jgi:hypothetical protein
MMRSKPANVSFQSKTKRKKSNLLSSIHAQRAFEKKIQSIRSNTARENVRIPAKSIGSKLVLNPGKQHLEKMTTLERSTQARSSAVNFGEAAHARAIGGAFSTASIMQSICKVISFRSLKDELQRSNAPHLLILNTTPV